MADERKRAERRVGLARLWARAKQVLTTDPTGSDEDDRVVDEEAARALAAHAGRLKGGLAKVAQLAAYDPGASLGRGRGATEGARAVLGELWDQAPAVAADAIEMVIAQDLGRPPEVLFEAWDRRPLAAASLGQVHAARLRDGTEVVVKVQYPGVSDALRADLADASFVRKLAGAEIGRTLEESAVHALADAVRRELDYRQEALAQARFAAAWQDDPVVRVPAVIEPLTSERVLTTVRARGRTVVDIAAHGSPEVRREAASGIFRFAWGSPLVHRLLNADPNPGNFLIEAGEAGEGVRVWCLDFGCAGELAEAVHAADRALWWALLDEDAVGAAERFRMALARAGLLRRASSLATTAHREWERALLQPLATHGDFAWSGRYASELAEATGRVLAAGGMRLPADVVLLWRQRLGAAAVIGLLDASAPFRRVLLDLIGTGRHALR